MTDNTMVKRKGQTTIYKTLYRKLTPLYPGMKSGTHGRVSSSCATSGTRRVTLVANNNWNIYVAICDTE